MAKKKSSKKSKTAKAVERKEFDLYTTSTILKYAVSHLNKCFIDIVLMICKDNTMYVGGMDESQASLSVIKIENVECNPFEVRFNRKKLEDFLKISKKEITFKIDKNESNIRIKSGRSGYNMGLLPKDGQEDIFKYIIAPEPEVGDDYYKFDVDNKDFAEIISMTKNLSFSDDLYLRTTDELLIASLLSADNVDSSDAECDISNVEVVGSPQEIAINQKFIKSFEAFNGPFTMTIPFGFPIISESSFTIEKNPASILLLIGPQDKRSEDEVIEEGYYSDEEIDIGDEPEELDLDDYEEPEDEEFEEFEE